MILAIPEYSSAPASPDQWDRYYNTSLDKIFIQVLDPSDGSYPNWVEMAEGAAVRDEMRHEITLVRSKYSAKDYQTFLDEIVAYISEKWGNSFNDFMSSDAAMMIAEYVAAAFDTLSWYMDRETDDHYMELARVSSNVARLARYLGYKPQPAVAGSADLLVTLKEGPYGFDVPLNELHRFTGPNGQTYELASDQVIGAGNTTKTVGVYQGITYTEVFTSDGTPNQTFLLSRVPANEFLARDRVKVTVDLAEWTEHDFLPYGVEDAYEVQYATSPPKLRFGDGVIGRIPPGGTEIRVRYTSTKGKSAGLAISGSINVSDTPVVTNFQTIPIEVTNTKAVSGGADVESMESIKANAPRFFISADRLVTQGDYEILAGSFSSISGAIAKANAIIVRGIEDDIELQALLDAINAEKDTLQGYLDQITLDQDGIDDVTGEAGTSGTIRDDADQIAILHGSISTQTAAISANVTTVHGDLAEAKEYTALAKTQLEFLPYQEIIGTGDGTTTVFAKTLAMKPIKPGSFSFVVGSTVASSDATDGDCDTTPGRLTATMTVSFSSADVGKLIRIGGQLRQIQKYIGASVIEYSGPRIYGTSLIVEVFPPSTSGYTDTNGNIIATGVTGSVNFISGSVSMTFTTAPGGVAGKYGVPIVATYQYINEAIQGVLDSADTEIDAADTANSDFSSYGASIDSTVTAASAILIDVDTLCDSIEVLTANSRAQASLAGAIPEQIEGDVDALSEYLDGVISSPCKANIVRVSCLTKDENGFYTAPSDALKNDLRIYLDERKIVTVNNSVVSGDYYLVGVQMLIRIKVEDQFVFNTVRASVESAMDAMLKDRAYGGKLSRSEYYDVIDAVDGVEYHNTSITNTRYESSLNTGIAPTVDANGNLFVGEYEVITKWEITVEEITD
jgi:hypothetical protein